VLHPDRVEHFFCEDHKTFGCRPCIELGHSKPDCRVVDLYHDDNPARYQHKMEEQTMSGRLVPNGKTQKEGLFKYGSIIDPALMDDDDDDDDNSDNL
jgi:hypothetical protein